jgi:hypothetical protein
MGNGVMAIGPKLPRPSSTLPKGERPPQRPAHPLELLSQTARAEHLGRSCRSARPYPNGYSTFKLPTQTGSAVEDSARNQLWMIGSKRAPRD